MKKVNLLLGALVLVGALFFGGAAPAIAQGPIPPFPFFFSMDLCSQLASLTIPIGPDEWVSISIEIPTEFLYMEGFPAAPMSHDDGRLNYRVCRAPLAVYEDDAGNVEVWTTDEGNMYAKKDLKVSATAEEIAAALAQAAELGQDVVIAGYVDGYALIAKPDGTLKAELIGIYGFDFMPEGAENNGWGINYDEWTIEDFEDVPFPPLPF